MFCVILDILRYVIDRTSEKGVSLSLLEMFLYHARVQFGSSKNWPDQIKFCQARTAMIVNVI